MDATLLTKKGQNNLPYKLKLKSNYSQFMSIKNQLYLSKNIYLLHKNNHGLMNYLYFREHVPYRMNSWSISRDINNFKTRNLTDIDILNFINRMFINENRDLHIMESGMNDLYHIPNNNVFRIRVNIGHHMDNNGNIIGEQKKLDELLASDIVSRDVWSEDTTHGANDNFRYNNEIPIWQTSIHSRNYDRSNEGFQAGDVKNASLTNPVRGYNMEDIYKISE